MSSEFKNKEKEAWNQFLSQRETFERESHKPYSFGILWTYVYRRNFDAILRLIDGVEGKIVLDIGCGGGWLCEWFTLAGATSIGLDSSIEFCRASKARAKRTGSSVNYVCADGENLPFKDDAFHASVAYQVFHHLPDLDMAIAEALRVSRLLVLGDEPAKLLFPHFLNRILKSVAISSLHVGELSGIKEIRFDPVRLCDEYRKKGYSVKYERQWSIVPTIFSRAEKYSAVRSIYKTIYKSLKIKPIQNIGHGLTMIIAR
jgi:SAM-dependent methyltransferase